jgi:hypothetical protein
MRRALPCRHARNGFKLLDALSQWLRERNWRITSKEAALDAPSPRAQKVHGVCEHQNKDPQVYCVRQVERSPSQAEPSILSFIFCSRRRSM